MALQLKHVSKFYKFGKNKQLVIDDLSINFPRTGLVAVVGKSGSGKSTLLNLIAGIEKADNGEIIVDGHNLNYRQVNEYQSKYISYVYQFYNLVEALTVYENLILLAKIKGKKISISRLHSLTDQLAITPVLDYYPKELSGGQKQRVSLIRAFLCDTPVLLADEPTGALNNQIAVEVMKLLKWYAKKHLVIVISHNFDLVTKYTKMIINLDSDQNSYNFNNQNNYHKYFFQFINNEVIKIGFYVKRQLIYQKRKIMMMFCSQIFSICAFVLLLSGINGGWLYLQTCLNSNPLKEIIEVSKKDYNEMSFTDEQFNILKKDKLISQLSYRLDFNLGTFKTNQELQLNSYQIYKSDDIDYQKGSYFNHEDQIMINQETAKTYHLNVFDKIDFIVNNKRYSLIVNAIINDYVNSGTNIYYDEEYLDLNLKNEIVDKRNLVIKSNYFKQIQKKYDHKYFIINLHQDYLDSYRSLFEMAIIVVIVFLIVSFVISLILISIILKTILIERKRDICLMLSNGMPSNKARKLFGQETSLIGILIGGLGSFLSEILLQIIRLFSISDKLFNISNLFILPKLVLSQYDLYVLMILVYMEACFIIGMTASLKIRKMDMSVLLKED